MSDVQISKILGISEKTLARIRTNTEMKKLNEVTSDRLYRVLNIFFKTYNTFEDTEEAKLWLKTRQFGLGNETPLSLLRTEAGAAEVENLIGKIEYGVYS